MDIAAYRQFLNALAAQGGAPTVGQRFGDKVWNADLGQYIDAPNPNDPRQTGRVWNADAGEYMDAANPLDPSQSGRWLAEQQGQGMPDVPGDLFSQMTPENLQKALALLKPIFDMQSSAMNQQMGRDVAGARRGASAYAASRGYDGAAPLLSRAENQVRESYAPRFDALTAGQSRGALGLMGDQYQSLLNIYNARMGQYGAKQSGMANLVNFGMQERQYQDQNSFDFFRDLMPGLLSGGFSIASAGLAPGGFLRGATGGK